MLHRPLLDFLPRGTPAALPVGAAAAGGGGSGSTHTNVPPGSPVPPARPTSSASRAARSTPPLRPPRSSSFSVLCSPRCRDQPPRSSSSSSPAMGGSLQPRGAERGRVQAAAVLEQGFCLHPALPCSSCPGAMERGEPRPSAGMMGEGTASGVGQPQAPEMCLGQRAGRQSEGSDRVARSQGPCCPRWG